VRSFDVRKRAATNQVVLGTMRRDVDTAVYYVLRLRCTPAIPDCARGSPTTGAITTRWVTGTPSPSAHASCSRGWDCCALCQRSVRRIDGESGEPPQLEDAEEGWQRRR
jgi:hypothetical protein